MKILFDDRVSVSEMNYLMERMNSYTGGKFPPKAIFHYSLRSDEKESLALDNGINVTARDQSGALVAYMRIVSDRSYIHYIVDVMVDPDFQSQGIGKQLLETAIDKLKEGGFIKIILTAIPGAEEFYKKLGFKEAMSPVMTLRGEDYV